MFPSCRLQFTAWVDAVIFVFSLENESSFKAIYNYYTQMAHFRNSAEIPLILVGTQGTASFGSDGQRKHTSRLEEQPTSW
uniref:Uncharacterized protein n=1 Tax=Timema douglasi TaxID=61478 RepID=A0A7R8VA30_TIMDO|nr:unnamed protein product [Timema douglasi]